MGSCYTKLVAITQGAPKEQKLCVSEFYKMAMVLGVLGGKNLGFVWKKHEKKYTWLCEFVMLAALWRAGRGNATHFLWSLLKSHLHKAFLETVHTNALMQV